MTPNTISRRVVADRLETIKYLLQEIRTLPLGNRNDFFGDRRNIWAAESCLRRSLEALLDIGRHILAKGYGVGASEYNEILSRLNEIGAISSPEASILEILAGYRNRLVHYYHEVSTEELCEICSKKLGDVEIIQKAYERWIKNHPDKFQSGI